MAKDHDPLAGFGAEDTGGLLSGLLAEEDQFDRRSLWRLGSWGVAAVGAVIVALLANQSAIGWRREQIAAADLARQSQQIQLAAKESQNEARRLASVIDTLNGDRDRLYSRVTVLEQGLDSVTGTIARQKASGAQPQASPTSPAASSSPAVPSPSTPSPSTPSSAAMPSSANEVPPAAQNLSPPPVTSPVATAPAKTYEKTIEKPNVNTNAAELGPATVASVAQAPSPPAATPGASMTAPPDSAVKKAIEAEKPTSPVTAAPMPEVFASSGPATEADSAESDASQTLPKVPVQRTEFGVDVGGANSVSGLRALWRGILKSRTNTKLAALQPIIVVKESNSGLGMQLRLVAGPLSDAAAAAKICAAMIESQRPCETTVFDGQRLAMKTDQPPASAKTTAPVKSATHQRGAANRTVSEEPVKKPEPTGLSAFFGGS
jgi:hypothetical protein